MSGTIPPISNEPQSGVWAWYERTPLYLRIVVALLIGVGVGFLMGPDAQIFKPLSDIVLRLLGALATPLIFFALLHALLTAKVSGSTGIRMFVLLMANTVVAILVGLAIANLVQPGRWVDFDPKALEGEAQHRIEAAQKKPGPAEDLLGKLPGSVLKPLVENDIMAVIVIALALGIALRKVKREQANEPDPGYLIFEKILDTLFRTTMVVLHWVFHLVPLAVFGVVARIVGTQGLQPFLALGFFVIAVVLALAIQGCYYLTCLRVGSWVRPGVFLKGASDALVMAFSTASSAATLPVTFDCMTKKIGVREENASMGIMVGGTFNHDGTALYEAMAALFISQLCGAHLTFSQQLLVVLMSVFASVGAAGIPEAGLVTMVAVFTAVGLDPKYIPLLLTVDWFLDRCRTAINVMGDMCVTCILDGKQPMTPDENRLS